MWRPQAAAARALEAQLAAAAEEGRNAAAENADLVATVARLQKELAAAVSQILSLRYIWWRSGPVHPAWIGSWHLWEIHRAAVGGHLYYAVINPAWKPKPTKDTHQ